jgi:hypothetical protein
MRAVFKNTLCILIIGLVIYLICLLMKPKQMKPLYMNKPENSAKLNANIYLNADQATNANSHRSQQGPFVLDRIPLVEENPLIIPANEIVQMNYKDCNLSDNNLKDPVEKEFYTKDAPLFAEKGPTTLVPFDLNDGTHRRVNFY